VKSGDHLSFIGGAFGSSLIETELRILPDAGRSDGARDVRTLDEAHSERIALE
jgi:hypothetical protein